MRIYGIRDREHKFVYVGSTTLTLNERFRLHKQKASKGSSSKIHRWLREHIGYVELLEEGDEQWLEAKWIAILGTHTHGLNQTANGRQGATGHRHSEETRLKMRLNHNHASGVGFQPGHQNSNEMRADIGRKVSIKLKSERWACDDCDLVSSKPGVGRHQYYSGHNGRTLQ